jgi:hypothetical protein
MVPFKSAVRVVQALPSLFFFLAVSILSRLSSPKHVRIQKTAENFHSECNSQDAKDKMLGKQHSPRPDGCLTLKSKLQKIKGPAITQRKKKRVRSPSHFLVFEKKKTH